MHEGSFLLFIVLVAGLLGKNDLIALAALVMLTLQAARAEMAFTFLSRFGVQVGVVFLLIGLLLPFAMGDLSFAGLRANLFSPAGLLAVTVGALSAYLAGEGVELLIAASRCDGRPYHRLAHRGRLVQRHSGWPLVSGWHRGGDPAPLSPVNSV